MMSVFRKIIIESANLTQNCSHFKR